LLKRVELFNFSEISKRHQIVRKTKEIGRTIWKQKAAYHRRLLAEPAMFRIKTLFGNQLKSRLFESQAVEAFILHVVLNPVAVLGLADFCPLQFPNLFPTAHFIFIKFLQ